MFEPAPEFVENLLISRQVFGFISYLQPSFIPLYLKIAKNEAEISLMLTEPVLKRFKADYSEDLRTWLGLSMPPCLFSLIIRNLDFTVTDRFFLLRFFPK